MFLEFISQGKRFISRVNTLLRGIAIRMERPHQTENFAFKIFSTTTVIITTIDIGRIARLTWK